MCPACMATAMLIAPAVSTGGVAALVYKLAVKEIARKMQRQQKEKTWEQHTSK